MNSLSITVSPCTGITEIVNSINAAIIYPNPADELATLSFKANTSGTYSIKMTDLFGKTIKDETANASIGDNSYPISLNGISKGVYFIFLQKGNDVYKTKLVVR